MKLRTRVVLRVRLWVDVLDTEKFRLSDFVSDGLLCDNVSVEEFALLDSSKVEVGCFVRENRVRVGGGWNVFVISEGEYVEVSAAEMLLDRDRIMDELEHDMVWCLERDDVSNDFVASALLDVEFVAHGQHITCLAPKVEAARLVAGLRVSHKMLFRFEIGFAHGTVNGAYPPQVTMVGCGAGQMKLVPC